MTDTPAHAARTFLDRFTSASDADDTDALRGCFAEVFLAGDATGVRPVPREAFLAAVPRRRQMFADAGIGKATLVSHEGTELDEHYLLVRTQWTAPRADSNDLLELSSSFLLHRDGDATTAVSYLNRKGL